eukprot:TRINITY_DN62789_c0_g1_i1.p3 TRINITY_DN62789_c0_g1~~TRINITY_DN62789_c0_g1_i1.p3  ORF type:complete len:106 (+),score=16.02 TRINITY_DN62789_c0_g1_i1:150-467(+)
MNGMSTVFVSVKSREPQPAMTNSTQNPWLYSLELSPVPHVPAPAPSPTSPTRAPSPTPQPQPPLPQLQPPSSVPPTNPIHHSQVNSGCQHMALPMIGVWLLALLS